MQPPPGPPEEAARFVTAQCRKRVSSANLEARESLGLFLRHLDRGDLGPARAAPAEVEQLLDRRGIALEDRLDAAVRGIPDPAGDPRSFRASSGGVAEEDSLNASADDDPLAGQ